MSKTGNPGFPHTSPVNVYGISYVIAYFSQVLTADVCAGPYSPLKGHSDTSGNLPEVSQLCLKKKKKKSSIPSTSKHLPYLLFVS